MRVLVDEGAGVDVSRLGGLRVEVVPRQSIPGRALRLVEAGEKVVAYYPGAWGEYGALRRRMESAGLNHHLYQPVDALEVEAAGGLVPPEGIIAAKAAMHAASLASRAHSTVTASKKVSRRDFLRNPLRAAIVYLDAPVLRSLEACANWRYCRECVGACPFEALSGKPPRLDASRCTGCGLCVASCPFSVLETPRAGGDALEYLIDGVRRWTKEPMYMVFACDSSAAEALQVMSRAPHPSVLVDIACPGWATPQRLLAAAATGFHPIVYCDGGRAGRCGGLDRVAKWLEGLQPLPVEPRVLASPGELGEALSRPPRARVAVESLSGVERTRLVREVAEAYGAGRLSLHAPVMGVVVVDEERCLLCEACSASCPYGALETVVSGDRIRLVFRHDRCTACGVCEAICPHDAIRIRYEYDSSLYGAVSILAEDEVARCRRCGAPLGSMRMLKETEERLRRAGASEWVLQQLWLCPKCKIYGVPRKS